MSKSTEIKSLQDYEETKKFLDRFSSLSAPGPEDVIGAIKSLVALELVNSTHNDKLAQEIDHILKALAEIYQKSSHTFASLNALMHYLKDSGLGKDLKLDVVEYEKVFNEKVIKPYKELQEQVEALEKSADPFNDNTFGAAPEMPVPNDKDQEKN